MRKNLSTIILMMLLIPSGNMLAQEIYDSPFLQIAPTPEGNGMGGLSSTLITDNALATSYNPGQLGLFAFSHSINLGTYLSKPTLYSPYYNVQNPDYYSWAGNIGYNLGEILHTSFPLDAGVGYSNNSFADARWLLPGGSPIADSLEESGSKHGISVGFGIDYIIQLGVGVNYLYFDSKISSINFHHQDIEETAAGWGFGAMLKAPILKIFSLTNEEGSQNIPSLNPFFDVITSYNLQNVGSGSTSEIPGSSFILPRNATQGLNIHVGISSNNEQRGWEFISITAAREANDLVVRSVTDTTFNLNGPGTFVVNDPHPDYQGLTGAIQFFKNVVMGQANNRVEIRSGLQLNLGEFLYIRAGSIKNPIELVSTTGFGIRLSGILKSIDHFDSSLLSKGTLNFLFNHFDLQFDYAHFTSDQLIRDGMIFESLNIVFK